jgi:hypothetical protein
MEQIELNKRVLNYFTDRLKHGHCTIEYIRNEKERAVKEENYELAHAIKLTLAEIDKIQSN